MNSLLKHQVKKYLSNKNVSNEDLMAFLDAVNRSYDNFDEQILMQQRAMEISSEELFEANKNLKKETEIQSNLIDKLNKVIETLNFTGPLETSKNTQQSTANLDGIKLAEFIEKQTQEIVEMNKQREKLMGELERQNEELSNYAYLVSHDLKSPLRSIDALTTWLNEETNGSETNNKAQNLQLIRANVERMDNLITGILNYSTVNKTDSQIGIINTNTFVKDIVNDLSIPSHITIKIVDKLPEIEADKPRIRQLFESLIGNAIKYIDKEKGFIEIGVKEEGLHWQFYVKDNGKGIEKAYFDKIFKPFQKLENNTNATGIGLSISKKIVNAYGGKIWLNSTLGEGTTFYFTLKK
ncbi:two-component sensor histidine kinase [Seonamhaeicola algicola]|uniref:histidine kinase n=1 Tax=Seonamhaeicola algicola TaxID=1719036 RepID=A0A5C7B512_9FLAO|nr:ATP-binding protein [Seonamhaeicola algicola]TXE14983.1 two-component sensor histidine kinase [Seonamhaeicola algicola]